MRSIRILDRHVTYGSIKKAIQIYSETKEMHPTFRVEIVVRTSNRDND
jgi:hypothetical protein